MIYVRRVLLSKQHKKFMVMTLGMGKGVEVGLAHSVESQNPDEIVIITTPNNISMLEKRLKPLLSGYESRFREPLMTTNMDNFESCVVDARAAILGLLAEGAEPSDIVVDFTSGTKAMSAGLCMAAALYEVGQITYVAGDRDEKVGRVIKGTDRVISIPPAKVLIIDRRRQMKRLFNERLFTEGLELTTEMKKMTKRQEITDELKLWRTLFHSYGYWDRFEYIEACKWLLRLLKMDIRSLGLDPSSNRPLLVALMKQRSKLEELDVKISKGIEVDRKEVMENKYSVQFLADVIANASRRATVGRFDDAVARLYRACELVAQIALTEYGIDSAKTASRDLPDGIRGSIGDAWSSEGEPLGMKRSFELLAMLDEDKKPGNDRALAFNENKRLKNSIQVRNLSPLAHGFRPATKADYSTFMKGTLALVKRFFPDVGKLIEAATFPKIEIIL